MFEAMSKSRVQPDVISYGAAIRAFEEGNHLGEAASVFEAMPEASRFVLKQAFSM